MRRTGSGSARALGALLLLVMASGAAAAEVEFYQAVDRNEVGTEELFRLTIVMSGAPDGSHVKLPASEDLEVLGRSQSTEMSMQMVGPGPASIKRTQKTVVTLRALRTGTLTIPGAQLITEAKTYTADPIQLKVVKGRSSARAQRPDPMDPFRDLPRPSGFGDEDEPGLDMDIPRTDSDLFLKASVDRNEVYVGEQVTLSLYIFSRVDLSEVSALTQPKLDGFWSEDVDSPTQLSGEQKVINGIPYRAYMLKRRALFPVKAGTVQISAAEVDVVTGFLFAGRRVHRKSNAVDVKVKPLPSQGRPAGFNGNNVGRWRLSTEATQTQVELGQPVTVKVTLDGEGNLRNVALPQLSGPSALRVFDPTTTDKPRVQRGRIGGSKTQEYLVMAQQTGEFVLPGLEFHYFDPETGRYEVSRTDPITLSVRPGTGGPPVAAQGNAQPDPTRATAAPEPGGARNVLVASGLRPLRYKADFTQKPEAVWRRSYFAPVVAAPLALWLGVLAVGFVRGRLSREDAGALSKKRTRAARKRLAEAERLKADGKPDAFYGEVEKALMGFLEAKLGGPVVGLTRDALVERMRAADVAEPRRKLVLRVLESCDMGRFAPGAGDQAREQVLSDAEAAMEGWE